RIGDEVADLLVLRAADDVELVKKAYASLLSFMAKYDGYESEFRSPLQLLAYHHPYLMEDMLRRAQTPPTFEPNIRKFLETVDDPEVTQTLVSLLGKELDKKHFGYELHLLTKAYFQGKISFEQLDAELAKHPNPNTDFTRKIIAAHQQQHYEQMADLLHKHIKPFGAPWMEYPEYQAAKNLLASVTLYTPVALEKLLPTYAKWTGGTNDLEISKNMKTFIALNPNRAAEAIPILNLLLHKGLHHSPNSYRPIFDAIAQAGEENVDMIIEQMAQNILHSDIHDAAISYGLMLRYGHRYNIAPTTLVLQARKTGRATIWERIKQMHLLAEANNPQALLRALPGIAYDDIVYEALRRMFRDDFRPSEHDIAALLEYYRSLDWDTPNQDKHKYTILNSLSENEFLSRQIILEQLLPHYYADLDKPITPSTRESLHNTLARLIKNNPDISRQFAQSLIKKIPANIENPNYKSLPRAVIRPLLAQWRNAMLIAPLTLIYAQNTDEKEALFYLASSLLYSPELQAHLMAQREALANPQTPRETDLKAIYDDMYAVWYYAQNGFQSEMVIKHMKSLFYYVPKDKSLSWASKTIAANMLLPLRDLRPPFVIKLFQSMLDDFAARNYQAYYSLHELRIVLPQAVWPYFHKYPSAIKYFGNDVPYQRILLDDDPAAMLVMLEESINFLNNQGITLERVVESPNYDLKFRKENSALWNKLIGVANYANSQNAYGGAKILDRPGRMLNERSEFGKKFMRAITLNHCARDPEKLRKQLKELTTDPNIKVAEFAKEILPLCVKDASS
ncbi:MAG: hypothetical protein MK052_11760, partial [Alphaproteobacteria bacterium]|nr:hypothetical protein [Alphaproteobacteria bacterium]